MVQVDWHSLQAQLLCIENLRERNDNLNASISQIIKLIGASEVKHLLQMLLRMINFYLVCPAIYSYS